MRQLSGLVIALLLSALVSCKGGDSSSSPPLDRVPELLFGANYDWNSLASHTIEYGDLVRDRSFRCKADPVNMVQVWGEVAGGGTVTWNIASDGDTSPAGGKAYTGYVELSRGSAGYTGITQQIADGISSGVSYEFRFSSYGVGSSATVEAHIYNSSWISLASDSVSVSDGAWTRHTVTLTPSADAAAPIIGIYLTTAATIRIDEIRMFRAGSEPSVKTEIKTVINSLGVKSLRWPGGTLSDWFHWKDSVGNRLSRGELRAYGQYETPALGLHEFLNLCEELDIEPLLQVNVLDSASDAADLVEYVSGSTGTPMGALRAANGRTSPWNVTYYEIGNEPAESYSGGSLPDTGSNYASLTNSISAAMKTKASSLGVTIKTGAVNEPCYQLADWLVPGDNGILDLLYNWNAQVFDAVTGVSSADFTNGHFYSSRYYSADSETNFRYAMSGGALLKKTMEDLITPLTSLPFWLTEYRAVIEDGGVVQVAYLKDFQSGLAIADILLAAMDLELPAAYIYSLIDENGFGIVLNSSGGVLRPGGLVFGMISVAAGEERLNVSTDNTEVYTVVSGNGNVPTGFSYPVITAVATKNSATGKPRVFLINRDYGSSKTVQITLEGFKPGDADLFRYENSNINADNESTENVTVSTETVSVSSPFVVTIPAHSLWRMDFK